MYIENVTSMLSRWAEWACVAARSFVHLSMWLCVGMEEAHSEYDMCVRVCVFIAAADIVYRNICTALGSAEENSTNNNDDK